MPLKSQDIVVLCKLLSEEKKELTYAQLADSMKMSASETHAAIKRLQEGKLLAPDSWYVKRKTLLDFLIYGISVVFPAREREVTRGIPTAWAAPVFTDLIAQGNDLPPVWAHPEGMVRGLSVEPLYRTVPRIVTSDAQLYDYLSLIDAIRLGRARERQSATEKLKELILKDG